MNLSTIPWPLLRTSVRGSLLGSVRVASRRTEYRVRKCPIEADISDNRKSTAMIMYVADVNVLKKTSVFSITISTPTMLILSTFPYYVVPCWWCRHTNLLLVSRVHIFRVLELKVLCAHRVGFEFRSNTSCTIRQQQCYRYSQRTKVFLAVRKTIGNSVIYLSVRPQWGGVILNTTWFICRTWTTYRRYK